MRRRGTRYLGRLKFLVFGLIFPLACVATDVMTGTAHVPGLHAVANATVELMEGGKVLGSGKKYRLWVMPGRYAVR